MSRCRVNTEHVVFRLPLTIIFSLTLILISIFILQQYLSRAKHVVRELKSKQYQCFSSDLSNSNEFRNQLLKPLLIERVSGTTGAARAREHILSKLRSTNLFHIELDTFDDQTPIGKVEFTNIVATLDPTATRRLVLACHYDSKMINGFIGATDSAVPCAILLDLAINLQNKLNELKQNKGNPTLQLIFFDGEEAFVEWTNTDSIYGSRHLATKMRHRNVPGQQNLNELDAMDLFILLDLIGHKDVRFNNFFDRTTGKYFNRLKTIESELLRSYNGVGRRGAVFTSNVYGGMIEDDHIPFLNYDVPILHLISTPFPPQWHQVNDNEENLDFPTILHIRNLMRIFLIEYLHLNPEIC